MSSAKAKAAAAAAAAAALPDLFIIEVVIEEIGSNKVLQTLSYSAEKAVRVIVREQIMLPHTATLPAVNPKTLYEDKVAKVTQIAVKKPEPPIKIGQQMVEL